MSISEEKKHSNNFIMNAATFIVDKRNLFFLIFIIAIIFSMFSRNWVEVENSLSAYLDNNTETWQGLDIMEREFVTFGTAKFMIANVSYKQAEMIAQQIENIDGISSVEFDNTEEHYNNASALFTVTFAYDEKDAKCLDALDALKKKYSAYDLYISTTLGNQKSEAIANEMNIIFVIAAIIIIAALILTSQAYAEVPVLLINFLSAAIINMGTNFIFGTISFVSNSVTVILQLALSIDYAIIYINRYKEEHATLPTREAAIIALSKAIPEITASSLTTIGGLVAMLFMKFKLGPDMGIVLIKAIIISLLSVFLLMPGLIILFSGLIDKTKHKNFVPEIPFVGQYAYATRKTVPPIFAFVIIAALFISQKIHFVYGYSTLTTPKQNETQIAEQMIKENFESSNVVALVVPAGDYEAEKRLLAELETHDEIDHTMGLSNIEAMNDYMLTDKLAPRQFSELTDLNYEIAKLLYAAYAFNDENYGKVIGGLSGYSIPLIDMFMFLNKQVQQGYVTLGNDLQEELDDAYAKMNDAKQQLQSENYSRMLLWLNLPEEGDKTFAFLDQIHVIAEKYYSEPVYIVGESTSQRDLYKAFKTDNRVVSIISILVVLAVLLFTFKSVGLPILLIMVIQGSIWINFSVPSIAHSSIFFISYLIVSSIQMGANIDYAIVISSRYMELRKTMPKRDVIIDVMNFAFPTIITSGMILAIAGILIGKMTSEAAIAGIGQCLGRGTIISIFLVMFVLPQFLLLGDKIIEKTSFTIDRPIRTQSSSGTVRIDGLIRGQISGSISGVVHAIVKGNVNAVVVAGEINELPDEAEGDENNEG